MMTLSIMRGWYGHLPIPLYNLLNELMSRWSTMLETMRTGVVFRNIFIDSVRKKNHLVGGIRMKV